MLNIGLKKEHQAATLAEIMLGIGIFSLIVLSIVGLLGRTALLDAKDEEHTEVGAIAHQLMEEYILKASTREGYEELEVGTTNHLLYEGRFGLDLNETTAQTRDDEDLLDYLYHLNMSYYPETGPDSNFPDEWGLKRIRIEVYHRNPVSVDPYDANAIDTTKANDGLAMALTVVVERPEN